MLMLLECNYDFFEIKLTQSIQRYLMLPAELKLKHITTTRYFIKNLKIFTFLLMLFVKYCKITHKI